MNFIIGVIVVMGCVLGGYVLHHGNLAILMQPTEVLIIVGAAVGSFIIGTPGSQIKDTLKGLKRLFKGMPYKKPHYIELLTMMYHIFKIMKSKGMLEMEPHIDDPHSSEIFSAYPKFASDHHAVDFVSDYLRLMTMGVEDYYQLEELMTRECDIHKKHGEHIAHLVTNLGDAFPALGIVAAVLGIIITMGSITEPPEILGGLIGAALVGTFLGILVAYGFVGPMGGYMGASFAAEVKYIEVIKVGLLAHVQGHAPAISVEFARSSLDSHLKPTFLELEEACSEVSV